MLFVSLLEVKRYIGIGVICLALGPPNLYYVVQSTDMSTIVVHGLKLSNSIKHLLVLIYTKARQTLIERSHVVFCTRFFGEIDSIQTYV